MVYKLKYEKKAIKQIQKLDNSVKIMLKKWIEKNLLNTENPRIHGKALVGDKSGFWRYRIGNYRLITEIRDDELLIIAISFEHRSSVYKK
ncbi:hypothetical protein B9N49_00160 [Finegoldia magna]|uniref:Type II toxin-antitoxin system mRNA interferase toxin, RelE/StbE family n=1 Tax=Finegoldia magna TaxID=1260 RepID=A0A233VA36_FINMA|nr:type II toxin-antitoxin system RelE/ParE family toxin [Finegoldia magna]MDU2544904.1 type II toxin-antitoxin system RelE/ParE family toxin [Finegoldia magna]OXZ29251.1 hypothetical protein B9N49_00160 [Finegoldia magna]